MGSEMCIRDRLQTIVNLLEPIGASRSSNGFSGVDVSKLKPLGTPCMGLQVDRRFYFNTHHTTADTVDKVSPKDLTDCSITLATTAFILADMPGRLGEK